MSLRFSIFIFCISFLGVIFVTGFSELSVGLRVSPINTIATQLGIAAVPFVIGWFFAKLLSFFLKSVSVNVLWSFCCITVIVLMFFGNSSSFSSGIAGRQIVTASNSQSGERVVLIGDKWLLFTQTKAGGDGTVGFLINGEWVYIEGYLK